MRIDEGHFGKTRLDGLKWAILAAWPGPIHLGNGQLLEKLLPYGDRVGRVSGLCLIVLGMFLLLDV